MAASSETIIYPYYRQETAIDSGDGLTFDLRGHDAQTLVEDATNGITPKVYVSGVLQSSGYTFNKGSQTVDCSITFDSDKTGLTITADYKWKYVPTTEEDFTAYLLDKELNRVQKKDAIGRTMVTEAYNPVTSPHVVLEWQYISETFYAEIVYLTENRYCTFDLYQASLDAPNQRVNDLYVIGKYPALARIPGVTDRINSGIEAIQIEGL